MGARRLTLAGEELALLGARALYWPARHTLVAADLHFGKTETFRAYGIPLPDGSLEADLARLAGAIAETGAERLIVVGDLVHHALGMTPEMVERVGRWRRTFLGEVVLVRGNHDRHAPVLPPSWAMCDVEGALVEAPLAFRHEPEPLTGAYVIAGHVHPTVTVRGGGDCVRAPCFHVGREVLVLPAFAALTGGAAVRRARGERVFAAVEGHVVEV